MPGELLAEHDRQPRKSMRLIERAMRGGWNIPESTLTRVPQVLLDIVNDPKAKHEVRVRAAQVLTTQEKNNVDMLKAADEAERGPAPTTVVTVQFGDGGPQWSNRPNRKRVENTAGEDDDDDHGEDQ